MKKSMKTNTIWLLIALAAVLVTAPFLALSRRQPANQTPQEIVLLARDIAFRLQDRLDQPNPPLQLTRGRPVRLTLRNEEPEKVLHCFTIGGLDVKSTRNLAANESEVLSFTPEQRGTFTYACLMHPSMAGQVIVE